MNFTKEFPLNFFQKNFWPKKNQLWNSAMPSRIDFRIDKLDPIFQKLSPRGCFWKFLKISPTSPKYQNHKKFVVHFFISMLLLPIIPPLIYLKLKKNKGPKTRHFTFHFSLHDQEGRRAIGFWKFLKISSTTPKYQTHKKIVVHFFIPMLLLPLTPPLIYLKLKKIKGPKTHSLHFHFTFTFTFTSLHP